MSPVVFAPLLILSVASALDVTTTTALKVREEPSLEARVLRVLPPQTDVEVHGHVTNGFFRLKGGGYISTMYARVINDGPTAEDIVFDRKSQHIRALIFPYVNELGDKYDYSFAYYPK